MRKFVLLLPVVLVAPAAAESVDNGQALFLSRCAACHGEAAKGEGPMAGLLTVPVADLTQLAARNGGEFPRLDVVRTIDGRQLLRGHGGDGPMPVFGPILGGGSAVLDGPEGSVVETVGDVLDIALYLESLQDMGN